VRAIFCNGKLAREQYMFGKSAYTGLIKDFGGNIADVDLVLVFGVYCVSYLA
jgi:hypothetical protein